MLDWKIKLASDKPLLKKVAKTIELTEDIPISINEVKLKSNTNKKIVGGGFDDANLDSQKLWQPPPPKSVDKKKEFEEINK